MKLKDMEWLKMKFICQNKIGEPFITIVWPELSICSSRHIRNTVIVREWIKLLLLCFIALLIRIVSISGGLLKVMLSFVFRKLWRNSPNCLFLAFSTEKSTLWGFRNCWRRWTCGSTRNYRKRKDLFLIWESSVSNGSAVFSSTNTISMKPWSSGMVSWPLSAKKKPRQ